MKRIYAFVFVAVFALSAVCAQELSVSGEFKTGLYMEQEVIGNNDPVADGMMKNNDGDSGTNEGRARLNLHLSYGNYGLMVRFQQATFRQSTPVWAYIFAYGKLFNDQLKISAGLLGESPWSTGGPKLIKELETNLLDEGLVGIRFEYTPSFVPGLNVGLVLNQSDLTVMKKPLEQTFGELIGESVIGVSYVHDYFAVRFGYRFDSKFDLYPSLNDEGARLVYRIEERALGKVLEGMQIWLNGYYFGIGANANQPSYLNNWLYWQYDTPDFITGLNIFFSNNLKNTNTQFTVRDAYQSLEFYPDFYYKLFDDRLRAGLKLGFGIEFGDGKVYRDSPYQFISVEPQVRLNIDANAYLALVYNFTDSYANAQGEKSQKHWLNLRAVYTF